MYSEQQFLLLSEIPNSVWKRNKLELSPGFDFLWCNGARAFSIQISSIDSISTDDFDVTIRSSYGVIDLPLKSSGFRCLLF